MSARWGQAEAARREAEKSRTEAELKNLRNQLNPHFLLNTLNNIYALIAFDSDKAQQAVQELSKLMRYVLYDNQQNYVPLCKEVDFIPQLHRTDAYPSFGKCRGHYTIRHTAGQPDGDCSTDLHLTDRGMPLNTASPPPN